ncbi:MAG: hypothetical protein MJ252_30045, partial [archaeon]|nr:hypothetical protein [archaeon]
FDKFFNPGGIATKASEVISFIQEGKIPYGKVDSDTSAQSKALTNDYGFSFSEVKGLPQLAKPCMLGKFITDKVITEKNYNAFLKQISKYGHPQLTYYSNPTGTLDVKLPYYLNSLFWLKLYSLQSPFYGDVNKDLTHQGTADLSVYDPFIFSMYMGLKEGYLESYRGELFRGSLMAKEELESLKERLKKVKETKVTNEDEIAVTVCTANCFLSFSKSEEVADDFIKQYKPSGNLTQVKFIINAISPKNKSYFVSNVVIGGLSTYAYEEEVLVLPFSCFEVVEIIPGKVTTIVLDQLYKKERKIKEYIKWKGKAEVMKFLAGSGESVINSGAVKECSSADFFNKKIILWIDQFANCKKYDDEIKKHEKELAEYQVIRVNSVDKGFNVLKMHENKLSYVILSQYLAKEFYLRYEDEALDNRLITANIVLCENNFKDLKEKYKKTFEEDGFLNDPYGNPGGFVETFDEALAYIKKDERDLKKPEKPKGDFEIADSYDTTFILDEGENIREGYFDIYKNKKGKPNEKVIQEDLKKFRYFIEKAYGKSKKPEVKELV